MNERIQLACFTGVDIVSSLEDNIRDIVKDLKEALRK